MRGKKHQPEVVRTWVATIKYKDDPAGYRTITTSVHGPNPAEADLRYRREHPDVAAIILHQENWR